MNDGLRSEAWNTCLLFFCSGHITTQPFLRLQFSLTGTLAALFTLGSAEILLFAVMTC
jgi:hypothetical protein